MYFLLMPCFQKHCLISHLQFNCSLANILFGMNDEKNDDTCSVRFDIRRCFRLKTNIIMSTTFDIIERF